MAFKFIKTPDDDNRFDNAKISISTISNSLTLDDLLGIFGDFLKASGFNFNGRLEIVEDETEEQK